MFNIDLNNCMLIIYSTSCSSCHQNLLSCSQGDTIQSKDSERRSMLNEIQWSLQLLARLAVGDPSNFVCNARISLDPSEMNIVALVTSLMDTLAMFEGQAKVIGRSQLVQGLLLLSLLVSLIWLVPSRLSEKWSSLQNVFEVQAQILPSNAWVHLNNKGTCYYILLMTSWFKRSLIIAPVIWYLP